MNNPCRRAVGAWGTRRGRRRGQALLEFAIIAFVLSGIVAGLLGILVLALGSFQNNIAAENAGRMLDGHHVLIKQNFGTHFSDPMDPDYFDPDDDFENVTARQVYRFLNEYEIDGNEIEDDGPVLYDESLLILTPAAYRAKLDPRTNSELPAINLSLLGQYIFDPDLVPDGASEPGAYRYPGAVVRNERTGRQTVLIPLLREEEVDGVDGIDRSFYVTSTQPEFFYPVFDDWVAPVVIGKLQDGDGFEFRVIMFHPSQPASTIKIEYDEDGNQFPVEANDATELIREIPADSDYELAPATSPNPSFGASPSRGQFGLGESLAFAKTVRPYRAVFETSSVFRMGTPLYAATYEADESMIPFPALVDQSVDTNTTDMPVTPFLSYEDHDDQSLDFEMRVVDRFSEDLRRYFVDFPIDPPASADNDFVTNVLQLLPNDDGVWRVAVAAEFETDGDPWEVNHVLQLWLYRNGVRESLITTHDVTSGHSEPISMTGQALIKAEQGDILQVRVFTQRASGSYEVRLTGVPESNWVTFERIGD